MCKSGKYTELLLWWKNERSIFLTLAWTQFVLMDLRAKLYLAVRRRLQPVPKTHEFCFHHSCGFMISSGAVPQEGICQKWVGH